MKVMTQLAMIPVPVEDQEEALHFYTEKLGLEKRTDVSYGQGLRLLTVAPRGQRKPELALAKLDTTLHDEDYVRKLTCYISRGITGRFDTENCHETYEELLARGVKFTSEPTKQLYGIEAVFEDPYGNAFSLLELSPEARSLFQKHRAGTAA